MLHLFNVFFFFFAYTPQHTPASELEETLQLSLKKVCERFQKEFAKKNLSCKGWDEVRDENLGTYWYTKQFIRFFFFCLFLIILILCMFNIGNFIIFKRASWRNLTTNSWIRFFVRWKNRLLRYWWKLFASTLSSPKNIPVSFLLFGECEFLSRMIYSLFQPPPTQPLANNR